MLNKILKTLVLGTASIMAAGSAAYAQTDASLIDKLVEKGILTDKEAADLRTESDTNFNQAFQSKMGLPDYVSGLKFYGDFKGRYEEINVNNPQYYTFDRFRYRLRVGLNLSLGDDFETGFRLGSGNPLANPGGVIVGGSSVSQSQDVNSIFAANYLWIDAAFGKWTAINSPDWTLSFTIGKMDNPFQLDNMVWDYDINPTGGAIDLKHKFSDSQSLEGIGALYILDDFNQTYQSTTAFPNSNYPLAQPNAYPYLYGGQILWKSQWTPKISSSLSLAAFNIANKDSLSALVQPFYNAGNSRNDFGFLLYHYNPVIVSSSLTYDLDSFPLYHGKFPVTASGEYMNNPGAPANNIGYRFGLALGKAGTKHTWQISYRYQELQADAWYDALVDDDNGAFYAATGYTPPTVGLPAGGTPGGQMAWATGKFAGFNGVNGWYGGTNVRGHLIQATYSLTDFLDVGVTFYLNSLIIGTPGQNSDSEHFMVDAIWRF
jgi:hypothetical protein